MEGIESNLLYDLRTGASREGEEEEEEKYLSKYDEES